MLRGQAAKKGKRSVIAMSMASMAYAMQKHSLQVKIEVLGARNSQTIKFMVELSHNWFNQGRYRELEPLAVQVVQIRREVLS